MYEEKLSELGIVLPSPPAPAGSYVPATMAGGLVFLSGQIPLQDGKVAFAGRVTDGNIEDAKKSARICAVNILAQIKASLGSLDKVRRIVRVSGFVNSDPGFCRHPEVINAASDLLFEVFGEAARHSRIAVGVSSLPLGSMTEIDAIVEVEQSGQEM